MWKWWAWSPKPKSHPLSFLLGIKSCYKLPQNFSVNLLLCLNPALHLGDGEEKKAITLRCLPTLTPTSPPPYYHPLPCTAPHPHLLSGALFAPIYKRLSFLSFQVPLYRMQFHTVTYKDVQCEYVPWSCQILKVLWGPKNRKSRLGVGERRIWGILE